MAYELRTIHIRDIQFAQEEGVRDGVLFVNQERLRQLVAEDRRVQEVRFDLAKPGDSCRILPVKDVIEPRAKLEGEAFPGLFRETMEQVGLDRSYQDRYPHEFSGGQRQRIGIARAIVLRPDVVICDEPVSALDVSIQAKIINLLRRFQRERELAYIFISHDLGVVRHIAHRVLVMYLGRVVEEGESRELFAHPLHPYTRALLDSVPRMDSDGRPAAALQGDVPSPADPPSGCLFHTRCPYAREVCAKEAPELRELGSGHKCACHFPGAHEKEEEQP